MQTKKILHRLLKKPSFTTKDATALGGRETGMDSLKAYLRRAKEHKPDLPKLARYAKDLRVNITLYMEALT